MTPSGIVRVVSAEIQRDGQYLLTQRSARAVLPLLWEFPGGRVRDGETDAEALSRALVDRVGVKPTVGEMLMEVTHNYPEYQLVLVVYRCSLGDHEPRPIAVSAVAWVRPDDFADYPFPGADQRTVEALIKGGS